MWNVKISTWQIDIYSFLCYDYYINLKQQFYKGVLPMQQSVNIAICEDEAAETKLLCDILDHNDIKNSYTIFTDADSFLASYERDKYDLLLMDIYMKDSMTGIEAVSMIRKKDADIPVAFITTSRDML